MDYMAKFWSPFRVLDDTRKMMNQSNSNSNSNPKTVVVGLKILTTTTSNQYYNNNSNPIFQRNQIHTNNICFLKSCFLCHKHLPLNKDVFMYRGDQGYCSQECRSRQIYIDDLTTLEKKLIRHRHGRRCSNSNTDTNLHRHRNSSSRPISSS